DFNDDSTSSDDDSPYGEDIDYVDASPPNAEIVSLEVVEIVVPEVGGIDTDILLTIKDDILREKLLNVNLLIVNIEALKDNPTPSFNFVTKSSSTFPNLFLEETNTFDNSLTESETFCFDLEENSSDRTNTRSDYSFLDYEAFYLDDDHVDEKSSGSTTTHADFSQYDLFIFDLSINLCPPADRSDFYHEEFADELAHIISPPEYDCFYFKSEPDPGELTSIVDSGIRENVLPTTNVNLPFEDDQSPLLAYVVWIFLPFLTYPVTPPYLLSCGNEDTIFDPGISIYHSFMPGISHRSGTFMKFNVYPNHLLPHGPMNSGSSQAQDSVNKNKRFVGGNPCLSILSSFYLLISVFVVVRRLASSILICLCFCDDCPGLPGFLKPLVLVVLSFDHKSFKSSASFEKSNILILSTNIYL
ncbi:hypothetical protein Tco_1558441, partial [Tanacetum coccineum]